MSQIIKVDEVRVGDLIISTRNPAPGTQIKVQGTVLSIGRSETEGNQIRSISFDGYDLTNFPQMHQVELIHREKSGADYLVAEGIAQRPGTFNTVYVFAQRDGSLWSVVNGVLTRCIVEDGDLDKFKRFEYKKGLIPDGLYKNTKDRMFLVLGSDLKFVEGTKTFRVTNKVEKDLYLSLLRGELVKL